FYVLKLTRPESRFRWKNLLHFGPLLLQQGLLALAIGESIRTGVATYDTLLFRQTYWLLQLAVCVSVITYLYWCLGLIERFYHRSQFNSVSDRYRHELRWLRNLLNGFGLLWILWIPFIVYYGSRPEIHAYQPFYILLAIITIRIAAIAHARPEINVQSITPQFVKLPPPIEARQKGSWLKKVVKANLYYQDPDLSLTSLAEKLELTPHELSRILNTVLKKSFVDFIGEFRVIEVAHKLQDPAYYHITLLGIAYSAGFNSKTTFHRTFRQITGKSPAEYKNDLKKVSPVYKLELQPHFAQVISSQQSTPRWSEQKLNRNYMFKNYLKIAWRNVVKNRAASLINVGGLAVGMAVAMLIGLWIWSELSFDSSFKNRDRIARVMDNQFINNEIATWSSTAWSLEPALQSSYGNNFKHIVIASWTNAHLLTYGDKTVTQSGNYMEPAITDMLSVKMLKGNAASLNDPSSILLSQSAAKAIFGDADPINKSIKIDRQQNAKITGVYENLPENSSFGDLAFIAPWQMLAISENYPGRFNGNPWGYSWFQTFVQVADNTDMTQVSAKINDVKLNVLKSINSSDVRFHSQMFLQPMKDWYIRSEFKNGVNIGGRIQYVWLFGIIGVFVLLLACINFMNLSTARSEKRAKEVGIRKAIGSVRSQLVAQFYAESLLIAFMAFCLALVLVQFTLPAFNNIANKNLGLLWGNPVFWAGGIAFTLFTGLVAGSYPALYLSSFQPIKVLKGAFKVGKLAAIPRKVLVVVQFTVSVVLIIGTLVVYQQIQFAKNRPVGYSTNNLLNVNLQTQALNKQYLSLRNDLLASGAVSNVAQSESQITGVLISAGGFTWRGKDPALQEQFTNMTVSSDFGKTVNWQIKEGRDFNVAFPSDTAGFIINEAAAKFIGLKHPVGETIDWAGNGKFKIIGVVKDMVNGSVYDAPKQSFFCLPRHWSHLENIAIKINPLTGAHTAMDKINAILKKYDPAASYTIGFVDQDYAQKFDNEERIGKLASCFAGLAIFISCLGLFGMASFMAEQRIKEIGVRKVLGATVFNLWQLLSKDFIVLITISLLIASPVAWYFMHNWLQGYQYRTEISAWIFLAAAAGALIITLLTVSYQGIKAALANPVRSLRSE
ncbi:MAG: ABC transporter permease, partial [Bacteroidota bacterium]